jgi:oxygen-dependent protoporphyrinogen oxidase
MSTARPAAVHDLLIVGGGIAGLAAAYEAQARGLTVRLLEAAPRPGGVVLTERIDGWVIDGGPDAILVQKPAAVALSRELGIADRLVSTLQPRTAFVLRDGRLHPIMEGSFLGFPIRAGALARSSLFSLAGKARMACEMLMPRGGSGQDESIAAFVRRRFGEEAVDYLADPLLAGIHAGDVDRLSMHALFPRLIEAERQSGSVIRAFRALHVKPSPQGAFVSFPGGTGELVAALQAALAPGTVTLDARVTELRRAGEYAAESTGGAVRARAAILAVPAYAAANLLRAVDTSLASLCDGMAYASTATVAFGYRRDQVAHPLEGTGFVVPRAEHSPLLAATWVSSKWPGRAPPGHVLLRAFLGGGRDPHRLERPDGELIDTARDALGETLGIEGEPRIVRLFRWTRQSPQYEVGHLERVAAIEKRLASIPGLFVTGSGFRAIGIPDCVADGRETASRAAAFLSGHDGGRRVG